MKKTRFGDDDIREIVNILRSRHNELKNEMGIRTDYIRQAAPQGDDILAVREDLESIEMQGEAEESEIRLIEEALERISKNEYGYCFGCGKRIPLERLRIIPYTKFCAPCEAKRERL